MTRPIKFRAWAVKRMFYFDLMDIDDGFVNSGSVTLDLAIDPPMMQFTGLLDKNGKEIFGGDIVTIESGQKYEVFYHRCGFALRSMSGWVCVFSDECEVIGDIYSNPELLEAK